MQAQELDVAQELVPLQYQVSAAESMRVDVCVKAVVVCCVFPPQVSCEGIFACVLATLSCPDILCHVLTYFAMYLQAMVQALVMELAPVQQQVSMAWSTCLILCIMSPLHCTIQHSLEWVLSASYIDVCVSTASYADFACYSSEINRYHVKCPGRPS